MIIKIALTALLVLIAYGASMRITGITWFQCPDWKRWTRAEWQQAKRTATLGTLTFLALLGAVVWSC